MDSSIKANITEKIHVKYVKSVLNLEHSDSPGSPDFYNDKHTFEMKSRMCIFYGGKPTANIWWSLSQPQIEGYESFPGPENMFWMLIHGFTSKPIVQLSSEKSISDAVTSTDIFIAPWEIYKKFRLQELGKAKRGPYRTISRKQIMDEVRFSKVSLPKGDIYLPKGNRLEYLIK